MIVGFVSTAPSAPAQEAKEQATFQGHTLAVVSVAYSPDGKTLASGSADKTIELWDAASAKTVALSTE